MGTVESLNTFQMYCTLEPGWSTLPFTLPDGNCKRSHVHRENFLNQPYISTVKLTVCSVRLSRWCYTFRLSLQSAALCCVSASTSSTQQRQSSAASQSCGFLSNISASNSIPRMSTSSSTLVLKGPNMAPHEHAVSLSYPHGNISPQRLSLTDTILQWANTAPFTELRFIFTGHVRKPRFRVSVYSVYSGHYGSFCLKCCNPVLSVSESPKSLN